ncbi:MAG: hypothetical protein ACPGLV_02530, partial [Bacteroidia bacterium]
MNSYIKLIRFFLALETKGSHNPKLSKWYNYPVKSFTVFQSVFLLVLIPAYSILISCDLSSDQVVISILLSFPVLLTINTLIYSKSTYLRNIDIKSIS